MSAQNAVKHYKFYPDEKNVPIYLAYGFRPILLILPLYMAIFTILWALYYVGAINLFFVGDTLSWHIYEFVYGIGFAGVMAFIFTGLPELFPGLIPVIGRRLFNIVALWVAGRVSFWLMDFLGVYIVGAINIALSLWIIGWAFKPVVLDRLQRHASIAYTIVLITFLQIMFFASKAGLVTVSPMDILYLSLHFFMILTLLALRRVNMEAINEILTHKRIDDVFMAKPYRYNLAIFTVAAYALVEFFYPSTSTLGWLGLAAFAALLGVLNDYNLRFESLLKEPFIYYLGAVVVLTALGYCFLGLSALGVFAYTSDFRHLISFGVFGVAFFVVMTIIAYVHTGRVLSSNLWIAAGVVMLVLAALLRGFSPFLGVEREIVNSVSAVVYSLVFLLFFIKTKDFMLSARVDGIKG